MAAHYFNTIESNDTGRPVANATIQILTASTALGGVPVDIYSDEALTSPITDGIITTNAYGFFEFWTESTSVVMEISYDGVLKQIITDVDLIGGEVNGDVSALEIRMDAAEADIDALEALSIPANATDLNMATARILGRTTASTGAVEELTASQVQNFLLLEEWAPNFTSAADMYIAADVAMTISQGNAQIGTGTLAYAKSTNAAPGTFTSTTLPATLEAGAWLRITASAVTGFVATHLKRTA